MPATNSPIRTPEERKQRAAELVAAGKLTREAIAKETGVTPRTIGTWKSETEFQRLVHEAKNAWRAKARDDGIADRDLRIRHANDEHKRLRGVILARAKDPQMQGAPGGKTGLLTVSYKMQSMGKDSPSEAVPEYAVDTGMLTQLRALREEVAVAKGESQPKPVEVSGTVTVNVLIDKINAGWARVAAAKAERDRSALVPNDPSANSNA
jgi:transposase-like protein